jgi:hypothetical protein
MTTAVRQVRPTVTLLLAIGLLVPGSCSGLSANGCPQAKSQPSTELIGCCCGAGCKCGEACRARNSQNSGKNEAASVQTVLRDLASIGALSQPASDDLLGGLDSGWAEPNLLATVVHATSLLAQHTFLRV